MVQALWTHLGLCLKSKANHPGDKEAAINGQGVLNQDSASERSVLVEHVRDSLIFQEL